MKMEPALIVGALEAVLALVVAFGLDLSAEQVGAIMAAATAVLAVVIRQSAYPATKVEDTNHGEPRV